MYVGPSNVDMENHNGSMQYLHKKTLCIMLLSGRNLGQLFTIYVNAFFWPLMSGFVYSLNVHEDNPNTGRHFTPEIL